MAIKLAPARLIQWCKGKGPRIKSSFNTRYDTTNDNTSVTTTIIIAVIKKASAKRDFFFTLTVEANLPPLKPGQIPVYPGGIASKLIVFKIAFGISSIILSNDKSLNVDSIGFFDRKPYWINRMNNGKRVPKTVLI